MLAPALVPLQLLQLALVVAHAHPAAASVAHITTTSAMRDAAGVPITDCLEPVPMIPQSFPGILLTLQGMTLLPKVLIL